MIRKLGLYETQYALMVPLLFAPVWTFLLRPTMKQVPEALLEAVRLESNSVCAVLNHAILPAYKSSIIAIMVLSYTEVWNMVEQPLVFLTHPSSYPLSLALSLLDGEDAQSIYAASVVFAFPAVILWRMFSDEVIRSIEHVKLSAGGQDAVDDS